MSPVLWRAPFSPTHWPGSIMVDRRCVKCCSCHLVLTPRLVSIWTGTGTKSSSPDPDSLEFGYDPVPSSGRAHAGLAQASARGSPGVSHQSSHQTVRPCSSVQWPHRWAINATRPSPRPSSEVASSARGAGIVDDPSSQTAMRTHDRPRWTMTSNSPSLPDAVCSKVLVASSDTHKIASSATGQPFSARATNRRVWATCSWRPGNTRRFARATAVCCHAAATLGDAFASSLASARCGLTKPQSSPGRAASLSARSLSAQLRG